MAFGKTQMASDRELIIVWGQREVYGLRVRESRESFKPKGYLLFSVTSLGFGFVSVNFPW